MTRTEKSSSQVSQAEKKGRCDLPHIPWVAKWLNLWQTILKALQFICCLISLAVLLTWNIAPLGPINFTNLVLVDPVFGEQDFRGHWYFYISVLIFNLLYVVAIFTAGFLGADVWPPLRTFLSLFCTILLLFATPTMSAALFQMEVNRFSQKNSVNYLSPKVALGFGFVAMILFVIDILAAFLALRNHRKGKSFIKEAASVKTARNPQIAEIVKRDTPSVVRRVHNVQDEQESQEEKQPFRFRESAI